MSECEFCNIRRKVDKHHYKTKGFRKRYENNYTVKMCVENHNWLHEHYSNEELSTLYSDYDSIANLLKQHGRLWGG